MHKKDPRYRDYMKRRLRSLEKRRISRKHGKPNIVTHEPCPENKRRIITNDRIIESVLPERFSIVDNPDEVIEYFKDLIYQITKGKPNQIIEFKFDSIKYMTIDALMYLIAIIKNVKKSVSKVSYYKGDIPRHPEVFQMFMKSGFLDFVKSSVHRLAPDKQHVQMFCDVGSQVIAPKKICDFVINSAKVDRNITSFLYNMIMELEGNTADHAYKTEDRTILLKNWYAYAEETDNTFRFTFLDTGIGICKTIYKKWHEVIPFLGITDADFVLSAMDGALLRSSTQNPTRGKGLPTIKKYVVDGYIQNLTIITNKAYCFSQNDNDIHMLKRDMKYSLMGTLYYWEVLKQSLLDRVKVKK